MNPVDFDYALEEALSSLRACCREVEGVPVVSIVATIRHGVPTCTVTCPHEVTDDDIRALLLFAARRMQSQTGGKK